MRLLSQPTPGERATESQRSVSGARARRAGARRRRGRGKGTGQDASSPAAREACGPPAPGAHPR
eukprot:1161026-Alexandrium_andersonii.AAC.1